MVFSVSSNEHTTKVVLSSNTRTGGTDDSPKFTLRTPITTPNQMISMVCLESIIIKAPSLLSNNLLNDPDNVFDVTPGVDPHGATYDWYFTTPPGLGALLGAPRSSMQNVLLHCTNNDMTDLSNVAKLLYSMCYNLTAVYFEFPPTPGETGPNVMYYVQPNILTGVPSHVGLLYNGLETTDLVTSTTGGPSVRDPSVRFWGVLTEFLRRLPIPTFWLSLNSPGTMRLAGPWVKLFGLNPLYTRNTPEYYTFTNTTPLKLTLRTQGYDMIHMHTNFCRSVQTAAPLEDNYYIVPSNILWSIQVISDPFRKTYFTNYNTAGKITYYTPILEEIEIYFSDEWGDRIHDVG